MANVGRMLTLSRLLCIAGILLTAAVSAPALANDQGGAAPVQTPPPAPAPVPAPAAADDDSPDTLVVLGVIVGLVLLGGAFAVLKGRGTAASAGSSG